MAWRCSGSTNAALVENLAANGLIRSERVKRAMLSVCSVRFMFEFCAGFCTSYVYVDVRYGMLWLVVG